MANYNALKGEADSLRNRYQKLQKVVNQTNDQLATLEVYAKEVSLAYGIKQKLEGPSDIGSEGKLVPSFAESLEDYNFLQSTKVLSLPGHRSRGLLVPLRHAAESLAGGRPPDRRVRPPHGSVLR